MSLAKRLSKIETDLNFNDEPYVATYMVVLDEDVRVAREQIKTLNGLGQGYLDTSGEPFMKDRIMTAGDFFERFSPQKPKGSFIRVKIRGP